MLDSKERCCGCSACVNICPISAIHMERDQEGFLYPAIDEKKCINCNLCEGVCAFKKETPLHGHTCSTEAYAVRNRNSEVVAESTSGGVFTALSDEILARNGYVIGCVFSEDFYRVNYMVATNRQTRDEMRGSKYVQAETGTLFQEIKALLEKGKTVLFTGTPCFADGLLSFIPENLQVNLYTCAIVCHGSPSPLIWEHYLKNLDDRPKSKITRVRFRDKKEHKSIAEVNENRHMDLKTYLDLYYSNCIMRPSCYSCKYTTPERSADLTMGDFWGSEKVLSEFESGDVSVVLVHSEKGKDLLNRCSGQLQIRPCRMEEALQENLVKPPARSAKRERVWNTFYRKGIRGLLKKYTSASAIVRCKKRIIGAVRQRTKKHE